MVMQGYGGLLPAAEAAERSIGMLECGPAAGVIGSKVLGRVAGDQPDVIATDMGGTTFKVSVIQNGEIEYAREPMVGSLPLHAAEDRSGVDRVRRRLDRVARTRHQRAAGRAALCRRAARAGLLWAGRHRADVDRRLHADRLHGPGASSWAAR